MQDNEITINGIVYVRKQNLMDMDYVLVRTRDAGVFVGYLKEKTETEITLLQSRWIWHWSGAATLSQLAMEGTVDPENCKFPMEVNYVILSNWIQILPVSEKAKQSIKGVKEWKVTMEKQK
jgi:hypothetical protein